MVLRIAKESAKRLTAGGSTAQPLTSNVVDQLYTQHASVPSRVISAPLKDSATLLCLPHSRPGDPHPDRTNPMLGYRHYNAKLPTDCKDAFDQSVISNVGGTFRLTGYC